MQRDEYITKTHAIFFTTRLTTKSFFLLHLHDGPDDLLRAEACSRFASRPGAAGERHQQHPVLSPAFFTTQSAFQHDHVKSSCQ